MDDLRKRTQYLHETEWNIASYAQKGIEFKTITYFEDGEQVPNRVLFMIKRR
jgi:hypothetical protein